MTFDSYPRPSRHRTIAHRLADAGYATGMVGLWHLGTPEPVSTKKELKRVQESHVAYRYVPLHTATCRYVPLHIATCRYTPLLPLHTLPPSHHTDPAVTYRATQEADPAKFALAAGGKVKKAVAAEYAVLQEHVKKVGGFGFADRLYAAPLDSEAVILPGESNRSRNRHPAR